MKRATVAGMLVALPLILYVAHDEVRGQTAPPAVQYRHVPRDADSKIAWFGNWRRNANNNCSPRFIPTLELVTPPVHGQVQFVTAEGGALPRTGCSNSFYGTAVMYRPNPGFLGEDQFTITAPDDPMAMDHIGARGPKHTYVIRVVGTAPGADATPASRQ